MLASSRAPRGGANARGRDLRPKSRRCAAVGLRNAPAGAVNPAPTDKFLCFGPTGWRWHLCRFVGEGHGPPVDVHGGARPRGRGMPLPYKPSEYVRPKGTAATHPDDRRAGCPHPAAPRGGANAPGGYGIRPYGQRRTPRNGRDRPPPPHHPAPLHKGLFLSLFYKNTALYLSHLRGGAAIRQILQPFDAARGFHGRPFMV